MFDKSTGARTNLSHFPVDPLAAHALSVQIKIKVDGQVFNTFSSKEVDSMHF